MEDRKVICDNCGADLTFTSNTMDYSIRVINRQIPTHSGAVTDMYIYPPLKHNLDFCGLGCMKKWMLNNEATPC